MEQKAVVDGEHSESGHPSAEDQRNVARAFMLTTLLPNDVGGDGEYNWNQFRFWVPVKFRIATYVFGRAWAKPPNEILSPNKIRFIR
jgi:hypothetical protein